MPWKPFSAISAQIQAANFNSLLPISIIPGPNIDNGIGLFNDTTDPFNNARRTSSTCTFDSIIKTPTTEPSLPSNVRFFSKYWGENYIQPVSDHNFTTWLQPAIETLNSFITGPTINPAIDALIDNICCVTVNIYQFSGPASYGMFGLTIPDTVSGVYDIFLDFNKMTSSTPHDSFTSAAWRCIQHINITDPANVSQFVAGNLFHELSHVWEDANEIPWDVGEARADMWESYFYWTQNSPTPFGVYLNSEGNSTDYSFLNLPSPFTEDGVIAAVLDAPSDIPVLFVC